MNTDIANSSLLTLAEQINANPGTYNIGSFEEQAIQDLTELNFVDCHTIPDPPLWCVHLKGVAL